MTLIKELISSLNDEALLQSLEDANFALEQAKATKGRIEQEIFQRIEENGATGIPSEEFKCNLKLKHDYTPEMLVPLIEIFSTSDLATCYTPKHKETVDVAAKWDVRKALPIAKIHGEKALKIIEQAKVEKSRKLDFGEK